MAEIYVASDGIGERPFFSESFPHIVVQASVLAFTAHTLNANTTTGTGTHER